MKRSARTSFFITYKALLLVLLGGAWVRAWGIIDYMPTMDEIQFLIISQGNDFAEIAKRALAEVHPPLVWFIRHYTLMLSHDMFAQRLVSVAVGLLTILAAYALGKIAFANRVSALLCAFLMAFAPQAIIASMGLRNYPFLLLLLTTALVFLLRWESKGRLQNLLLYTICICAAVSSHFSAFMISAALGMALGFHLLLTRRWWMLVQFSLAHLPIAGLALLYYMYYFAPGTTIPMWHHFIEVTGYLPKNPERGVIPELVVPLLAYFTPFIAATKNAALVPPQYQDLLQSAVLIGGALLFIIYIAGIAHLRSKSRPVFHMVIWVWIMAISFSLTGLYPLSANRHSVCMLPFFILPFVAFGTPFVELLHASKARFVVILAAVMATGWLDEKVIWADEDFCLRTRDYEEGQSYLHSKLEQGDSIITGPMGAYFYLIYAKDFGKTPYNDYTNKPYINDTTLMAPFASPYKPYNSWQPFRDELEMTLNNGSIKKDTTVWFVQYGWRNEEIWTLMHCRQAHPFIQNFFSRDGVIIFSMTASDLTEFLYDRIAWDQCYANYKPLVIGTPFKKMNELP